LRSGILSGEPMAKVTPARWLAPVPPACRSRDLRLLFILVQTSTILWPQVQFHGWRSLALGRARLLGCGRAPLLTSPRSSNPLIPSYCSHPPHHQRRSSALPLCPKLCNPS
jgi:hypothetical protein